MSDFSGIDPSIAALLDNIQDETDTTEHVDISSFDNGGGSKFSQADFEKKNGGKENLTNVPAGPKSIHNVDLSVKEFQPVDKFTNDEPSKVYDDPNYYKTVLTGENSSAQRVHQVLSKYLTCQDPKDRAVYRQNIISAYLELLRGMAPKLANPNVPMPKRMLARFGILLPSLFRAEQKDFFSKMIVENKNYLPIMYVDEWLSEIASGRMNNSMTDEKRTPQKAANPEEAAMMEQSRLQQLQSKNSGKLQSAENLLNIKENERGTLERELQGMIEDLCQHNTALGLEPHMCEYTEIQLKLFAQISDRLHRLSKNNKELTRALNDYKEAKGIYENVENKLAANGEVAAPVTANANAINTEFDTIRQMAKMTVGRQGNQFPLFTREFYHCTERGTGTRENVVDLLRWVEERDPGAFCRVHKSIPNRIPPYVLLIPTYGDRGFCWEPFDRYNRVTSRGRIVVPMYPRDLKIAVLTAVADLRWQVAKEKASYYWMEEGLTGQYYQHFEHMKLKGDLKAYFIEDYVLWMTKESEGVQRLDKDVRGIFWRNMPFPEERKQELRKRSLVYNELCIKDANRAMSDGY